MSEHVFSSVDALDNALATEAIGVLKSAINERGKATLVVSGGSTPRGLFAHLANADIEWSRVTITLADDRWVNHDHDDSNEKLLTQTLLTGTASAAQYRSLTPCYPNVDANLKDVIATLDDFDTYDLVILGMGGDKHTASLFPCCEEIDEGLATNASALMTHPTTAPHARISQSLKRLKNSRKGIIHIVGEDKRLVFEEALSTQPAKKAPIAQFAAPNGNFELWYAPKH